MVIVTRRGNDFSLGLVTLSLGRGTYRGTAVSDEMARGSDEARM